MQSSDSTRDDLSGPLPSHPKWPQNVKIHMSTRLGGYSVGPYASLNLGDHVGDDASAVNSNRAQYQRLIGVPTVYLKQVHQSEVVLIEPITPDAIEADVCLTHHSQLACTIMVADCLPVLMTDSQGILVGAAHAGWRGLAGLGCKGELGVIETLIAALEAQTKSLGVANPQWLAWLGPCIGPKHFEVGSEVRSAFIVDPLAESYFKPSPLAHSGKWLADLAGLAKLKLGQSGVQIILGNDSGVQGDLWCTYSQSKLFYSHRRDKVSGRLAASIWLD